MADPSYIPSFFSVQMKLKPQSGMREILVCFCLASCPPPASLSADDSLKCGDRGLCCGVDRDGLPLPQTSGVALHQGHGSNRATAGLALAVQLPSSIPPCSVLHARGGAESGQPLASTHL